MRSLLLRRLFSSSVRLSSVTLPSGALHPLPVPVSGGRKWLLCTVLLASVVGGAKLAQVGAEFLDAHDIYVPGLQDDD